MASILEASVGGDLLTRIKQKANLSFVSLRRYLNALIEAGLLRKEYRLGEDQSPSRMFVTTTTGFEFLSCYGDLLGLFSQNETVQNIGDFK